MPGGENSEDNQRDASVDEPDLRVEIPIDSVGSLFTSPTIEDLYERISEEVVPILDEHGARFGDDALSGDEIRDIAAYFLLTHGLIEDETALILEYDLGGNRQRAGHINNIDSLYDNGIISSDFRDKMVETYQDRKATHHGVEEMLDQLLDDFEIKVDRMWEVRTEIYDLVRERYKTNI